MSNQRDPSTPARLYGDGPVAPIGATTGIGDLVVAKSGESILFTPRGPQGEALPITSIRGGDDVQILELVGVTRAASCTLTFGGATTAPIPLQSTPPLTSFVWKTALPKPGTYDVALSWGICYDKPPGSQGSGAALVEVFGSGRLLGSVTIDQSQVPDAATGVSVPGVGLFRPVGTFAVDGTDLLVRLSGEPNSGLLMAGPVRVAPAGSAELDDVGFIDPDPYRAPGSNGALEGVASAQAYGNWSQTSFYSVVGGWHTAYYGVPSGVAGSAFPEAADVAAALSGLAAVQPGGLTVTATSPHVLTISFSGPMGGQAWPTMTCSDPAIQVVHDGTAGSSVGGDWATVTINGVAHELRGMSFAAGKPSMAFQLIQDAPALQYLRYSEGIFQTYNYYYVMEGAGYGGRVARVSQAGPAANWPFQGLAGPAEFQVDVTWPGGDPAADLMECAILDGSGAVLATISGIDQSKAPGDSVDAAGAAWKSLGRYKLPLQVNSLVVQARAPGNPGKYILIDTVRLTRVSPDRGVKIRPGDSAVFHMPVDFVRTTAGPVPSVNVPLAAPPATRLPAIPQVPKSMRVGYNCDYPVYWNTDACYANFAIQVRQPFGLVKDAAGNPIKLHDDGSGARGTATSILNVNVGDSCGRGFGVPTCSPGVWVLQWNGPPSATLSLESMAGWTTVTEIVSRRQVSKQSNRRFYQVATSTPASPNVLLRFSSTQREDDGTYTCPISGVAVYPPDVDPDSPQRWRPGFLKKLRGMHCFRFMDMLGTNDMNLSEFSHLPDQANFPLGYSGRTISVPIESIGPPEPDPFTESGGGVVVRVKTKVPHGLATGFLVSLRSLDGSSLGQVTCNAIDSRSGLTSATARDPVDPTDNYQGRYVRSLCRVIDATTVQVGIETAPWPPSRMTNTLTPVNAVLQADLAPNARMSPADMADLVNETGLEPWVNVPWLATDDCVRRMAQILAAELKPGLVTHVEYGNEPWNYTFIACGFCVRMANLLGLPGGSFVSYYVTRMGQVQKIFRDAWAAAGRDPAEVRRVCGVHLENPAATSAACLDFAAANGIAFDELAPATYYNNAPAAGPLDDLLTRDQLLDLLAMNLQQSDMPHHLEGHVQACRDSFARNPSQTWIRDVMLVNYEGGPDTMTTSTMTANVASRNHAVHRHPDFCEIELHHLQILEDAGVKLFNIFTLYGTRHVSQWGVYEGFQMEAGTGDPAIDVANVDDFENLSAIKSETAAALVKWSAMVGQSTPPPPPPPPPPVPPARKPLRNSKFLTYGTPAYAS